MKRRRLALCRVHDHRPPLHPTIDPPAPGSNRCWPISASMALLFMCCISLSATAQDVISSVEQLKQMRIGVTQGSAYDVYADKNFPDATVLRFNSQADLITALVANKLDAGMADGASLRALMAEQPRVTAFGESLFDSPSGVGFRKDSTSLRGQFNKFLAQAKADGTLEDIERRWRKEGRTTLPTIAFDTDAPVLKVGNSIMGLPNVTYVDNLLVGSEIEIAMRFAQSIGHRPEFVTVDWGALIPSLISGKIDVIISDMFITPEREESIGFSNPYRQEGNYFFVLKSRLSGANNSETAQEPIGIFASLKDSFYRNIIREDRYKLIFNGLWVTVIIALGSCILGTAFGVAMAAMRMSSLAILHVPAHIFIEILRGVPAVVLLMLIFYVVFGSVNVNPVAVAVFSFGLMFAAYSAEIFRAGLLSIDRGQTEAAVSLGFTQLGSFRHIILPQLIQRILPVYRGEFISMVKNTSIVGYVAVQDLTKVGDIIRSRTFDAFFPLIMVTLIYLLLIWLLGQGLTYIERRTDPERRRARLTP